MKVAPVELVEEKPPRFRAGCCDRKRRTPTRYRCHCEFSFSPSLRPPFIIMLGQSACPSWCSGLQLDPSLPRVASQPARPGAAARRFPLSIAAVHGQSACPSWCSGLQLDPSSPRAASQPARLGAAARRFSLPSQLCMASQPARPGAAACSSILLAARGQSACPSWCSGPPVSILHVSLTRVPAHRVYHCRVFL